MARQILSPQRRHGFTDLDTSPQSIDSLFEKLSRERPVVAINLGSPGAQVLPNPSFEWRKNILGIRFLKDQVAELLKFRTAPDLGLIWIGHNDVNLISHGMSGADILKDFRREFKEQVLRVVSPWDKMCGAKCF